LPYDRKILINEVVIDKKKYVLPCQLKEFFDNGWEIDEDDNYWIENPEFQAGDIGTILINKGNIEITAMIGDEYPIRWEDLIVYRIYVYRDDWHPGLYSVQFAEGVNTTMFQAEVDRLLSGIEEFQYSERNYGMKPREHIYEKMETINELETHIRIICKKKRLLIPFSVNSIEVRSEIQNSEQLHTIPDDFFTIMDRADQ